MGEGDVRAQLREVQNLALAPPFPPLATKMAPGKGMVGDPQRVLRGASMCAPGVRHVSCHMTGLFP